MAKKQHQQPKPTAAGGQLRQAIRDSGLSLYELGRRTGIDTGRLSRFMREERDLTVAAAEKILEALGLQIGPSRKKPAKDSGTRSSRDTEAT